MNPPRPKQPRSEEVRDTILNFIRTHFYQGHFVEFAKHRRDLLRWVVFSLSSYLDARAVWLSDARIIEIMTGPKGILMEAARFMLQSKIRYLPAYLKQCVQRHFDHHGEDYYNEGKSLRTALDTAMKFASTRVSHDQENGSRTVREQAAAARLLKPKKVAFKPAKKQQLNLL